MVFFTRGLCFCRYASFCDFCACAKLIFCEESKFLICFSQNLLTTEAQRFWFSTFRSELWMKNELRGPWRQKSSTSRSSCDLLWNSDKLSYFVSSTTVLNCFPHEKWFDTSWTTRLSVKKEDGVPNNSQSASDLQNSIAFFLSSTCKIVFCRSQTEQ